MGVVLIFVSHSAFATKTRRKYAKHSLSETQCLANVIVGESNGTPAGMKQTAGVILLRRKNGEGSICSLAYAHDQFVGVKLAPGKSKASRALAAQIAAKTINDKSAVGKYREFRTASKHLHCKGPTQTLNGNTYMKSFAKQCYYDNVAKHGKKGRTIARSSGRRHVVASHKRVRKAELETSNEQVAELLPSQQPNYGAEGGPVVVQ